MSDNKKISNVKPMISMEMINNIDSILSSQKEIDDLLNYIQRNEPHFYNWSQRRTSQIISGLSRYTDLRISVANRIAHGLLLSFLGGYLLSSELDNDTVNSIIQTPEQEFETWLSGQLPDNFYNYSINGLDKNSTKYIAKKAHINIIKTLENNVKAKNKYFRNKSRDDLDVLDGIPAIKKKRKKKSK